MHIKKLSIRHALAEDSDDILSWRNNPHSVAMSLSARPVEVWEHRAWYAKSLADSDTQMYIGKFDERPVGVCRIEVKAAGAAAVVAINLAPASRGNGLGLQLLILACEEFLASNKMPLEATVKEENVASLKMFQTAGFKKVDEGPGVKIFKKTPSEIFFKSVELTDAGLLYSMLENRRCNISHKQMPSYSEHKNFVAHNPYLAWYLIYDLAPIGSFYVKADNSVGLNLLSLERRYLDAVLAFISKELSPAAPVPSMVPENFFINVAVANEALRNLLEDLGLRPIQVSYDLDT